LQLPLGETKQVPSGPVRSALVGVILGVDATALCLALATTCFSGALVAGLGLATGLFLFGSVLATRVLFHFGGFRKPLAISQDTTISILAPAVILAASAVAGPVEAKVATGLAVIGTSAIVSGVVFWGVGRMGWGRLVRMFPYPVAAGFLASSGYLLVYTALSILTGQTQFTEMISSASDPLVQLRLLPGVVMAFAMVMAMRLWAGSLPVLAIVFLFMVGFYVALSVGGVPLENARALGLLPPVSAVGTGIFSPSLFVMIDWRAVATAAPVIAAVVLLNLIGLLLNTSGVELATRDDVDENSELQVTGLANVVIGSVGGLTCYLQSGASIIADKLGVQPRAMVLGHNIALLVACGLAPIMVASVPIFVPAALLMFIGISMLEDWLVGTARKLVRSDWLIVLCIVMASAAVGILPAIALGLTLAVLLFAYTAIRLPVIRHSTSATQRRSIRDRNVERTELLAREGHRIRILHLQGSLFFGSVEQLTVRIRKFARLDPVIQSVVIDFSEVSSFDSSACAAMEKLIHVMDTQGIATHATGVPDGLIEIFERWGLPFAGKGRVQPRAALQLWTTLDQALEHCESSLISQFEQGREEQGIGHALFELGRNHKRCPDLLALMERVNLSAGEALIMATQQAKDVFFVVSGQLGVHLPKSSGASVRVRSMGPGTIVGEIAYLTNQPRNADVICEEAAEVLKLSESTIKRIEDKDRDLAALLMSIFSRSLASKLAQTNALLTYSQSRLDHGP